MIRRWLLLLAIAFAFGLAVDAGAQSRDQRSHKARKAPADPKSPLRFYVAKGDPDACGAGCSEWIAAEGYFDQNADGRLRTFLKRQGKRRLPIYFSSAGGNGATAIAMGRQLRQLGIATGVAKTVPHGCSSSGDQSQTCRAAKRSSHAVHADWRPDGRCNSACVYALIGGKVRHVPPPARLGVHAARLTLIRKYSDGRVQRLTPKDAPSLHKARAAEFDAQLRRYIREMGIDNGLFETAAKVPNESVHYLTRDQIAAFGIDRRDHAETGWFIAPMSANAIHVSNWIVEARGPGGKDYRTSIVSFSCSQAHRATVLYLRGLASDEVAGSVSAALSIGKRTANLALARDQMKQDAIDTGALFSSSVAYVPFDELDAAAAAGLIRVVETDQFAAAHSPRVIHLTSHGLAEGIKTLRSKCVHPTPAWAGTGVPYAPAQGAAPNTASPNTDTQNTPTRNTWLPVSASPASGPDRK
jgi:hypothetical protein